MGKLLYRNETNRVRTELHKIEKRNEAEKEEKIICEAKQNFYNRTPQDLKRNESAKQKKIVQSETKF